MVSPALVKLIHSTDRDTGIYSICTILSSYPNVNNRAHLIFRKRVLPLETKCAIISLHTAKVMKVASMRYFVAGNFWLFIALTLFMCRQTERTSPVRVSFLGVGTWFEPATYNVVVFVVVLVAAAFLVLSWKHEHKH